jgi:uncharacterized protein (PEP-CTERM system associated)
MKAQRSLSNPAGGRLVMAALAGLAVAGPCVAQAPDADTSTTTAARSWAVEPSVALRQTFTDNRDLSTRKASDSITELTGAVRVSTGRGAVRGALDYALTGVVYARDNDANELRHVLSANALAELIAGTAFVDVRGNYQQQAVSAFGTQSRDAAVDNRNSTDVGSLLVAPYVRGRFGAVRAEARASLQTTRAKDTMDGDVDEGRFTVRVDSGESPRPLGWFADASRTVTDYRAGRRTHDDLARAGLSYRVGPEWRIGAHVGQERTDLATLDSESTTTGGIEVDWIPSVRTNLNAAVERRFFGTGHSLRFAHRTPNTAWAVYSSRDISSNQLQGTGAFGTAYDLFFRQFASTEPDEIKRDQLVRDYMRANGIDPRSVIVGGFLTAAVTLQRSHGASVALVGVRNTLTLRLNASNTERADRIATAVDDLSSVDEVRQRGAVLDWSHRLTPESSLSLAGAVQRSTSDTSNERNTLKTISLSWTARLGPRTTATAGARRADFDSRTSPYVENAVFAAARYAF